jgi:hypothetical protein
LEVHNNEQSAVVAHFSKDAEEIYKISQDSQWLGEEVT